MCPEYARFGTMDWPTMSDRPPRILLADDEQSIQTLLSYPLQKDGYEVVRASDGREALARFGEQSFDLVVLDVMMPQMDGLEVCRRLRARSSVPIIMLTAKAEEIDKVLGLELGADDYITKPFSMREFRSRVKATLRRAGMTTSAAGEDDGPPPEPLRSHELVVDLGKRSVRVRGEIVQTTFVEFEILAALAQAPGRVFTRDLLLTRIWGDSAYRDPRTIDVHIRHLREKLEQDAKAPEYIFTVRGVGYRFRDTTAR
jgi:DNA-binding response OmpR family regulator